MKNLHRHLFKTSFALLLLLTALNTSAQQSLNLFFDEADAFFSTYVQDGLVAYQAVSETDALASLTDFIATVDLGATDASTAEAFYINAYNILVIQKVLENYPLESVLDKSGFFDKKDRSIAGKMVSLNAIEKDYLLGNRRDARFHFVLVCGANGCPPHH